jgi:hypothetical protein
MKAFIAPAVACCKRSLVGRRNVVLTALETPGIAVAAALAGFLIGKLVTHQAKDGLII